MSQTSQNSDDRLARRLPTGERGRLLPSRKRLMENLVADTLNEDAIKAGGLVLAINGERGIGKTSFLMMYLRELAAASESQDAKPFILLPVHGMICKLMTENGNPKLQQVFPRKNGVRREIRLDEAILSVHKTADRWRIAQLVFEGLAVALADECNARARTPSKPASAQGPALPDYTELRECGAYIGMHDKDHLSWVYEVADTTKDLYDMAHELATRRSKAAMEAERLLEDVIKYIRERQAGTNSGSGGGPGLLLLIDDLDLSPNRAPEILEDLWTYLGHVDGFITVVTLERPQLLLVVRAWLGKKYAENLDIQQRVRLEHLSESLIDKTIFKWYSLHGPALDEKIELFRKPKVLSFKVTDDIIGSLDQEDIWPEFKSMLQGKKGAWCRSLELDKYRQRQGYSAIREQIAELWTMKDILKDCQKDWLLLCLHLAWTPNDIMSKCKDDDGIGWRGIGGYEWIRLFLQLLPSSIRLIYSFEIQIDHFVLTRFAGLSMQDWWESFFKDYLVWDRKPEASFFNKLETNGFPTLGFEPYVVRITQALARCVLGGALLNAVCPSWEGLDLMMDDPKVLFDPTVQKGSESETSKTVVQITDVLRKDLLILEPAWVGMILNEGSHFLEYLHVQKTRLKNRKA